MTRLQGGDGMRLLQLILSRLILSRLILSRRGLVVPALFFACCQWVLAGCAGLPQSIAVSALERDEVETAFLQKIALSKQCLNLDAEVTVSYSSFFQDATLSGYLQVKSPALLKFVAINPLGQPFIVLVTDGERFRYLSVPDAKVYDGSVHAKAFSRYAPKGLDPGLAFYWLAGMPPPDRFSILGVSRDSNGNYWVELCCGPESIESRILYDKEANVVKRHIALDRRGKVVLDVRYDDFTDNTCGFPGKVIVSSLGNNGTLEIYLSDFVLDADLPRGDFVIDPPTGFKKVLVQ